MRSGNALACGGIFVAVLSGTATASETVSPVPKSGPLKGIDIDHEQPVWSNDGGYICFYYFNLDGKRYHIEVNAPKGISCPQRIYIGDRP